MVDPTLSSSLSISFFQLSSFSLCKKIVFCNSTTRSFSFSMSISSPDSYISDSPNIGTQISPESDLDLSLPSMYMMQGFVPETCPESQICYVPWSKTHYSPKIETQISPESDLDLSLPSMYMMHGFVPETCPESLICSVPWSETQISDNLSPSTTPLITSDEDIRQSLNESRVSPQKSDDLMLGILIPGYKEMIMRERAGRTGDGLEVALVDGPVGGTKSQVSDNHSPTTTPFISPKEEIRQRLYGPRVSAQEINDQMLGILLPGYTETIRRRRAARAGDGLEVAPGD